MYTIGQVAKFLGVSRDTLKFYEEKGLVNPMQAENGYRKYNQYDIYDVLTTNFYRELDVEIKKIQEIRQSKSIDEIEAILEGKEEQIIAELEYKRLLLKRIRAVQEDCKSVKHLLGKCVIQEMKPIEVRGEITSITAYDEYEIVNKQTESLKEATVLTGLRRVITFDDSGITNNKFLIVRDADELEYEGAGEILAYPKCIYTVVEDGRYVTDGQNIDNEVGSLILEFAESKGHELLGVVYINMLLTTYEDGLERVFVEVYAPIQ